ncbi:Non-structural polyprotein 1A [Bienertia sinuspersici]
MLDRKRIFNDLWSEIHGYVSLAKSNEEDLLDPNASNNHSSKTQDIEMLIGADIPTETLIKLKDNKEKAMEQNKNKKRLCRGCGELGYHDIRNCPSNI